MPQKSGCGVEQVEIVIDNQNDRVHKLVYRHLSHCSSGCFAAELQVPHCQGRRLDRNSPILAASAAVSRDVLLKRPTCFFGTFLRLPFAVLQNSSQNSRPM